MVQELKDKSGGAVCNTHLVASTNLNKLIETQKLHDTWRKINPEKIEFTYDRPQSDYPSNTLTTKPCLQNIPCEQELVAQGIGN